MARDPLLAAVVVAVAVVVASSLGPGASAAEPPVARGLSFDFYRRTCPRAESIVRGFVQDAVSKDIGLAAGLLRLHFHDCFVQGCDASVLLDGSATGPGEQQAPPNLTLRPSAFKAVNDIRDRLERECRGAVVSCADILALAARDSVVVSGGPDYRVPLGRRDSRRFATRQDVLSDLPAPSSNVPSLLALLRPLGLDATDLVTISGGHTIGQAHCSSFEDRLFPRPDPTINPQFLARLKGTCPAKGTDRRTVLDVRTPNMFDNQYYVDLVNREGLFVSDQDLFTNAITRPIVERFARSQRDFFEQFGVSMGKMGQMRVRTSDLGEVRRNCSTRNPGPAAADELQWSSLVQTIVDAAAERLG
ncbi:hypothetical protein ACQJBY_071887 [Aegilops geniculata]